ncbi:hypothetical protein HG536_0G04330 [Torulaspora globosa]|uniref:Phosphatidylserine decarboxylase proenzyme 1, mitochondrial n=1 Tax=Torulaspora globosa TaxID=48254 RepID=A0A7G3ZM35_9SACH|nr:uncharacterized protein HG536_0G04330 [Torulaspora globosa]QLL34571.1 hypothetical protein HG536_0G04330 [Torulaspora globosa]
MIPVGKAFTHGRTIITMPVGRLAHKIQLRNRTATLWSKNFSSGGPALQKPRGDSVVQRVSGNHAGRMLSRKSAIKWVVLTGVTIALSSIILNSQHNEGDDDEDTKHRRKKPRIKIFDNDWLFFCYSTLPLNALSRLWGQVNSLTLPVWFRPWGYKCYSYLFGVNMDEMADPDLRHYANLSEFFYRSIKPDVRPIHPGANVVVCPSDGKVLKIGIIDSEKGEIEQVKGLTYSIKDFLGTHSHPSMSKSQSTLDLQADEEQDRKFAEQINFKLSDDRGYESEQPIKIKREGDKVIEESKPPISKSLKLLSELSLMTAYHMPYNEPNDTQLYFAVIYLAPGDYHHYHSPVDWVCKLRRHFPGDLFSVAPYFQRNFPNLFVLNERVALLGHWKHGFFSMTAVGATNVGSIKLSFDKELVTNVKRNKHNEPHSCYEATYQNASKILDGMPLLKGDEMGGFMLGSTVVLCFEAPKSFRFNVKVGDKVKLGQKLGTVE